jgi:hypothetical protein
MGEDNKNYSQEIQDRIRELAYSMWESAGRLQGLATEYWLAAEKEVLATMRAAADNLTPGKKPEKAEESTTTAVMAAPSEPSGSAEAVAAAKTERAEESTTAAAMATPSEPSEVAVKAAAKAERAEESTTAAAMATPSVPPESAAAAAKSKRGEGSPTPAESVRPAPGRTRA